MSHLFLNGQNLVNNPSFENYSVCPSASGEMTLAIGWYNPTNSGTPDYLNACSSVMGVPYAGLGFQFANSGNGMAGIWSYCDAFSNAREYFQSQLISPLTTNNFYLIKYHVNRANWSNFACNNISCLLSSNSTFTSGVNGLINANPQISKFENDMITDTLNWVKILSIYQASGGENYITIGNFKNDASTTYSNIPGNSSSCAAYYLLDDISLENITTPQWQYRDTTVYLGDSVLIGPAVTGLNIDWFDMSSNFIKNAPGIYVKPTVNTNYQATETFNSAVYNHTVNVIVLDPVKVNEYDKLQNSVAIYPNPTQNKITISSSKFKTEELDLEIVDVIGKKHHLIVGQDINHNSYINLQSLDNGVYFICFYNKQQLIITKKIIKE